IFIVVGIGVLIAVVINNDGVERDKRARERVIADEQASKQDVLARSLIASDQLVFTGTSLKKETFDWKFSGTVKNGSERTLTEIHFRLTMSDCAQSPCIIIGESDVVTRSLLVPPGQARAFSVTAVFADLPP